MADDDAEGQAPPGPGLGPGPGANPPVIADSPQAGGAAPPKDPGWYPVRTSPNEQTYWDGRDWTKRRRWSAGTGWTESGPDALVTPAPSGVAPPGSRLSANPYAPHPTSTTSTTSAASAAPGITLGLLLLVLSALAAMVGSVTTWISSSSSLGGGSLLGGISSAGHTVSTASSGVDAGISSLIGINGYITLIAAVVVLMFAGLMAVSTDQSVRLMGCVFALVSLGLSIYAVVRLVQKINDAHPAHGVSVNVGWGVLLVLGASVLATLITLFEVTKGR
jgi:hypothetical protein